MERFAIVRNVPQGVLSFCYRSGPEFREYKKLPIFVRIVHDRDLAEQRISPSWTSPFGHARCPQNCDRLPFYHISR